MDGRPRLSHAGGVINPNRRVLVEFELATARRRAAEYWPFSPAWDAAMGMVEELERTLALVSRPLAEGPALVPVCSATRRRP
jgi:hypothetical protein